MLKRKKILVVLVGILVMGLLVMSACSNKTENAETREVYVIKATHPFPATHPWNKGLEKFSELVGERSNGQIKVEIYPSGQLSGGNTRTQNEQVQAGTLQMVVQSPIIWTGWDKRYMVYNLPFMFPDRDTAFKVVDNSEIVKETLTYLEDDNIKFVDIWENGFRNITNTKRAITKPEDLKGLKIRIPETNLFISTFKTLGADPTIISMGEVYTSLQQGTVDGQENPLSVIHSNKFYEVCDYLTVWGYCWDPAFVAINKPFFDSLPSDLQQAVIDCVKEAGNYEKKLIADNDARLIQELEDKGMKVSILTPEQQDVFITATKPVYDEFESVIGKELINKFRAAVQEAQKN